ncbi:hypothetical protein ABW20_dc0106442 [Dactylellina cionopaga]|nr:hypothetical protein ABW20_dc0106442 [Dactylellina cionopaga]
MGSLLPKQFFPKPKQEPQLSPTPPHPPKPLKPEKSIVYMPLRLDHLVKLDAVPLLLREPWPTAQQMARPNKQSTNSDDGDSNRSMGSFDSSRCNQESESSKKAQIAPKEGLGHLFKDCGKWKTIPRDHGKVERAIKPIYNRERPPGQITHPAPSRIEGHDKTHPDNEPAGFPQLMRGSHPIEDTEAEMGTRGTWAVVEGTMSKKPGTVISQLLNRQAGGTNGIQNEQLSYNGRGDAEREMGGHPVKGTPSKSPLVYTEGFSLAHQTHEVNRGNKSIEIKTIDSTLSKGANPKPRDTGDQEVRMVATTNNPLVQAIKGPGNSQVVDPVRAVRTARVNSIDDAFNTIKLGSETLRPLKESVSKSIVYAQSQEVNGSHQSEGQTRINSEPCGEVETAFKTSGDKSSMSLPVRSSYETGKLQQTATSGYETFRNSEALQSLIILDGDDDDDDGDDRTSSFFGGASRSPWDSKGLGGSASTRPTTSQSHDPARHGQWSSKLVPIPAITWIPRSNAASNLGPLDYIQSTATEVNKPKAVIPSVWNDLECLNEKLKVLDC